MNKIFRLSIIFVFVAVIEMAAVPFPGLGGKYPAGNGCIFQLLECSIPGGGGDGRGTLAFIHGPSNGIGGDLYSRTFSSAEWGTYGFSGTGIIYATIEAWSIWNSFWSRWGDPNQ